MDCHLLCQEVWDQLPELRAVVVWNEAVPQGVSTSKRPVYNWEQFMALGQDVSDEALEERMSAQKPSHCCTLIYTSGTTGNPKAVMVSHDNITWTVRSAMTLFDYFSNELIVVSYLPLSHIAAQLVDLLGPLCVGGTTFFADPSALKGTLVDTLREVRPTGFLGIPRVWEKIQAKMIQVGMNNGYVKQYLASWAKQIGLQGNMSLQQGGSVPWGWTVANKVVFENVKKALGLDRCLLYATGAAPIHRDTLDYFLSLNIPITELYGMSECCGPATIALPVRTGTCGKVIPGAEVMIANPEEDGTGEVLMRGRHVFMGYLFNNDKTREAIDDDGWLHSGDIGKLDEEGNLIITGRIKELIITAGGENIAPIPIEDRMKEEVPILSNVMVIGDRLKFLSMLVTLKCEVDEQGKPLEALTAPTVDFLKGLGSTATTVSAARTDPKVIEYITQGMQRANDRAVSRAQRVQKFAILEQDFSIDGGEIGPTLKLRRPKVLEKFDAEIAALYKSLSTM
eukprot:m.132428 g.132428  ORF g.132428 m.132428 type:complete len:510 (+) comp13933_c0_seq3:995-2524(+)